jgi:segregation and condensation protein B
VQARVKGDKWVQLAKLQNILDAILLSTDKPLSIDALFNFFAEEDLINRKAIKKALKNLKNSNENRGFELKLVASGYRYQTRSNSELRMPFSTGKFLKYR